MIACLLAAALGASATPAGDSAAPRIATRDFPSIFQAWSPATPLPGQSEEQMIARHDLFFGGPGELGLEWEGGEGTGTQFTPDSLRRASRRVAAWRKLNPHLVVLVEVRYHDAPPNFFPADSPYWKRDAAGQPIVGWPEGGFLDLDFGNPKLQALVAQRAHAVAATGFLDGLMLDWWIDDPSRLALIRAVRRAVGDKLILVNGNDGQFPLTALYVNGTYMECTQNTTPRDWAKIGATLRWAEHATRAPRIDCLETWWHQSRHDLALMRATTTLALTQSDGYALFADPDPLPTPDHLHDWYPFWDKGLGVPIGPGVKRSDGSWRRRFTHGDVIYNPPGQSITTVHFDVPHRSRATGRLARRFSIAPGDGDIFGIDESK